jgi:hypothetical protein
MMINQVCSDQAILSYIDVVMYPAADHTGREHQSISIVSFHRMDRSNPVPSLSSMLLCCVEYVLCAMHPSYRALMLVPLLLYIAFVCLSPLARLPPAPSMQSKALCVQLLKGTRLSHPLVLEYPLQILLAPPMDIV